MHHCSYEEVGRRFIEALRASDRRAMQLLLAPDATWSMPGSSRLSSTAEGADAVLDRAVSIATSGIKIELLHVATGAAGVALLLHNTGSRPDGRTLDEHLAVVLTVVDGLITQIDTYLSDVPGMEAFFS